MTKKQRDAALAEIETGAAKVIVGTHSLISDDVVFASLGIAVVDEQHRFGVEQRAALASKGPIGGYVARGEGLDDHAASIVAKENEAAQSNAKQKTLRPSEGGSGRSKPKVDPIKLMPASPYASTMTRKTKR